MSIGASIDLSSPLLSFLGFGVGSNHERKTSIRKEKRATLYGTPRIALPRTYGEYNAARWVLTENEIEAHGIMSELKTAILVKPMTKECFGAIVKIDTDVDVLFKTKMRLRKFTGAAAVDPVYFAQDRDPMGPSLKGLSSDNLSELRLEDIGAVNVSGPSLSIV